MRQPAASTSRQQQGTACCSKVGLKRGPWTPEEDEALARYIRREGEGRWRTLPKRAGLLRCGKSCRLRWMNYLRPDVKRGHIAPDEEDLILRLHRLLGNRWSLIAGRIPGRTDNEIKNYWNTHLSKKLISQGIDPRTHKPLLHPNDNPTNPNPNPTPQAPPPNPTNPNPNPEYSSYTVDRQPDLSVAGDVPLHFDQNSHFSAATLDGGGNQWRISEGIAAMNPQRSIRDIGNETGSMYFCAADDIYSSFLNSLISEDTFMQQHHHQQQQQDYHNLEFHQVALAQFDAPVSSASGFGFGEWWEASSLSCPAALDQDIAERFQDHIGKHL